MEQWGTVGTLMAQWGIVVVFGGTMAVLVNSFLALPKTKRKEYSKRFRFYAVVIGLGTFMQLTAAIIFSFV